MKNRILYFDVLRILATFCIIMIHVSGLYVTSEYGGVDFAFGAVLNSFARVGVPIFIMISGANMLNERKKIETKSFLKKYALNIATILIFWTVVYTVMYCIFVPLLTEKTISLISVIEAFHPRRFHFWFLYMIVGLYMLTPILKLFVNRENKTKILYLIGVLVIFAFVPQSLSLFDNEYINIVVELFDSFKIPMGYLAYYLIGWYLSQFELEKRTNKVFTILGVISVAGTIVTTIFYHEKTSIDSNMQLTVLFASVWVFVLFKDIFKRQEKEKMCRVSEKLSRLTFGAYLIHILFITACTLIIPESLFAPIRLIIIYIITTVASFTASFVISKIPYVKMLVRG